MKKVLFAVALVMGLGSSVAFANNMASDVEIVAMVNEFKPIDIKELPQAVQDAIKKDYAESTIKEAAVEVAEDGAKTYKGEFYQFNLSSCIRQQNSLTAQFVSFSLSNLANIFYPPQFLQ